MPTIGFLCLKTRVGNRITDREMVNDLFAPGRQIEIMVHFLIVERANSGSPQSERFRGEIHAVADGAGFEMHVAVTTIAVSARCAIEITDHRERHTRVACQFLPEAQSSRRYALIATPDLLQLGTLRPEPVHTRLQSVNAMNIQIKLDEGCAGEISGERPGRDGKDGRELHQ